MTPDEIVKALRICNRAKGHRCSECPVFSRYEHGVCKRTVDRDAADLIESLQAQLSGISEQLTASQRREQAAYAEANNAIYFSDSSDYLTALYEVCRAIAPEADADYIGAKHIEEISLQAGEGGQDG